ncbi:cbb3-type cytochrome c oxidase subunit 3 [Curvivirga sp.]|uniref:cbb3-type cytochrome c oxidase subunit 3 n=1 Tax=Curvivirga sp. TaxID=2856848 RepID=UPI003B5CF19C
MDTLVKLANDYWNLWLGLLFIGIVIVTLWPSKKRDKEMNEAANIPLMEDEPNHSKGA